MKTEDLISFLAADIKPVERHIQFKCFFRGGGSGSAGVFALMVFLFGINPDIDEMFVTPLFWFKIAFPMSQVIASLLVLARLSRPGVNVGKCWIALPIPVLVIWMMALVVLVLASKGEYWHLVMGFSWQSCVFNILILSLPMCVTIIWSLRQLVPIRLRLTGAVAGLLAGSVATVVYCLHCPEMGVPFWGIWYLLGMLAPAALGAIFGTYLLRW